MLDIALIRKAPDWVKQEIAKLNDEAALERIDRIVELDGQRRATRTRIETAQAARNKLNRAMGKLRGNRNMPADEKAARARAAASAIATSDYEHASDLMAGAAKSSKMANWRRKPASTHSSANCGRWARASQTASTKSKA